MAQERTSVLLTPIAGESNKPKETKVLKAILNRVVFNFKMSIIKIVKGR